MNKTDKLILFLSQQIILPWPFCKTSNGKKTLDAFTVAFQPLSKCSQPQALFIQQRGNDGKGFEMQNRPQTQGCNVTDALYLEPFSLCGHDSPSVQP